MLEFTDIEFGYKSAEAERRNRPELLRKGFFEHHSAIQDILEGAEYLVLGHKGSGKSAIAEHLHLMSSDRHDLFVDIVLLRDFPFDTVPNLASREGDLTVRTNLGWSILLLLKVFESIWSDQKAIQHNRELLDVADQLRKAGLLPKKRIRDLALASREANFGVKLAEAVSASVKSTYTEPVLVLSQVRDKLRSLVCDVVTDNDHLIIVDGLDEVFNLFNETYTILASLVHEIDALNSEFDDRNACAKIVLLCRTDLFERLPSANINKLRDYAILLDWYHNPARPQESQLFAVATHRAALAGYKGKNVLQEFLPRRLVRKNAESVLTAKFLLDHTRHTPRDFFQMLFHIQNEARRRKLDETAIFDGLREYSIEYFLPELKDELAGYLNPDQVEGCLSLIGGLRKREFSFSELETYGRDARVVMNWDLRESLRVLFDCSAIGNLVSRPRSGGTQGTYYTFKFRNRNASINFTEKLLLHRGVWKALNIS